MDREKDAEAKIPRVAFLDFPGKRDPDLYTYAFIPKSEGVEY